MFRLQFVNDMERMQQEMDQLFRGAGFSPVPMSGKERIPLKIREQDDHYAVEAILPGLDSEQLDISLLGRRLTISGAFRELSGEEDQRCLRRERRRGHFEQSVELPEALDADKIEAAYSNGILAIRLPKAAEVLPRKIAVKAA